MEPARPQQRSRFRCPLCHSQTYAAVEITLKNGTTLKADFYHCTECSLHFVHPERFSGAFEEASGTKEPPLHPALA